ncbi:MAG: glycosyltransferase family 2 protein [Leptospiraceae bacterium]|nr:glycosyltransferase family 2 protein [Leptospiraceae bacterium]MDW8306299.1 glycosyltransferase family 2 protein [Leptospiraceae bacterium]
MKGKSHKSFTVAAVVVTYNRKELLVDCLNSLIRQKRRPDAIYVIDNASQDGTPDYLIRKGFLKKGTLGEAKTTLYFGKEKVLFFYKRLAQNLGGAGGFAEGMKAAYGAGYSHIWLMDDDALAPPDTLAQLLTAYEELQESRHAVAALCPHVQHESGYYQEDHHKCVTSPFLQERPWYQCRKKWGKYILLDTNSFVGPLFSRKFVEKLGFPEPTFFIRGDDTEYTYRLSRHGKLLLLPDVIMIHRDRQAELTLKDLYKFYYHYRNKIWFIKKFHRYNFLAYGYYLASAVRLFFFFVHRFGPQKETLNPLWGLWHGFGVNPAKASVVKL